MAKNTRIPKTREKIDYRTSAPERMSFYAFAFGQNIIYMLIVNYLNKFFTDIGISAASVAIIFLIARIWDAINDPMCGVIVNKCNFKGGKYKPWLKVSNILIAISSILLFALQPSMAASPKFVLALVLYIFWGMSYTICDVPYYSVINTISDRLSERYAILGRTKLFTALGVSFLMVTFPLLYTTIGWFPAGALFAVIAFFCMLPLGHKVEERFVEKGPSMPVKDIMRSILKNKYLLILCIAYLICNVTNVAQIVATYFAQYCLGNEQLTSLIMIAPMAASVVFIALVPSIIKKVDKFTVLQVCSAGAVLLSIVIYFAGYQNLMVFLILSGFRTACMVFSTTFIMLFVIDCAEYGRYAGGRDITPVAVSIQTLATKAMSAFSSAFAMFLLAAVGFKEGTVATQTTAVTDTIWLMTSIIPAAGFVVAFIIFQFCYKLRDKDVAIMAKVNLGEISREEAATMFKKKF